MSFCHHVVIHGHSVLPTSKLISLRERETRKSPSCVQYNTHRRREFTFVPSDSGMKLTNIEMKIRIFFHSIVVVATAKRSELIAVTMSSYFPRIRSIWTQNKIYSESVRRSELSRSLWYRESLCSCKFSLKFKLKRPR